jgi:hypothetical protein
MTAPRLSALLGPPFTALSRQGGYAHILRGYFYTNLVGTPFSDSSVTGSVARAGSFRGQALIVRGGTDPVALAEKLRDLGIFVESPISVPA